MGGCIARPPREMRSDSGGPMGNGFGGGKGEGGCYGSRIRSGPKAFNQTSGTVEDGEEKGKEIVG